jgi:predicted nucleic acid-binding protein
LGHRIYIETTVVSYLTALPSRDLIVAAHQQITHEWWESHSRGGFDLYVSQAVVREAAAGDENAARRRLLAVEGLPLLDVTREAEALADRLVTSRVIPASAAEDALHIALAAVHGMDYLLTWNCKHLANAALRSEVETLLVAEGYRPPIICTPEELTGA